jgi:hypothetical protein
MTRRAPIVRLLQSLVVGTVMAVAVSVLWVLGTVAVVVLRVQGIALSGSSDIAAVSTGAMEPLFFIAPLAFLIGFSWRWRRSAAERSVP